MHNYIIYTAHIFYREQLTERVNLIDHIKCFCKQSMAGSKETIHRLPRNNLNPFHSEEIAFKDTALNINNILCIKMSQYFTVWETLHIYRIFTRGMVQQIGFFSLTDLFSFDQRLKFFHIVVTGNRHSMIQSSNTCKEFYYLFYVFSKKEKRKQR